MCVSLSLLLDVYDSPGWFFPGGGLTLLETVVVWLVGTVIYGKIGAVPLFVFYRFAWARVRLRDANIISNTTDTTVVSILATRFLIVKSTVIIYRAIGSLY